MSAKNEGPETPDIDVTGDFTPHAGSPPSDATGVHLPEKQPVDSPASVSPSGSTGVYERKDSGATAAYIPPSTQSPAQQGTIDRAPDGTCDFVADSTGARSSDSLGLGLTGDFDPSRTRETPAPLDAPSQSTEDAHCGRYVLKRFHAKGGMGEIWLADDPAIGRPVALKRMLGRRADQQRRFRVEAQVTGQLEHPGIVPVHELGTTEDGLPFYAMKFVRGRTLQKVIQEYHRKAVNTPDREVERLRLLQIFISLCQTVAYAHSRGVLHRDLKPENVMLGPFGETLLLDWGIAKVMDQPDDGASGNGEASYVHLQEETEMGTGTQAGSIMGSPSYMAPEVASGLNKEVDQRSDVYLLGATLYEVLTGRLPREGKTAMEMIKKAQRQPPLPPRKINPRVVREMEAICMKAMSLRKEDRYQSALAMAEDIQRYVAGEPVSCCPESFAAKAWRWAKRHRQALMRVGAGSVIAGLLVFAVVALRAAEERRLADLRASDERRAEAQRETERLQRLERARRELKELRRLGDEARFYAATTDPVAEHSPYFDPREGETKARAAFALADKWGPRLEGLPFKELKEDPDAVKKELYDLYLLAAQAKSQHADLKSAKETLALLDKARTLRGPSRSYYRFRAWAHAPMGAEKKALNDRARAEDPKTRVTSLDHFLLGEQLRKASAATPDPKAERKDWQPDPDRIDKAIAEYKAALVIEPGHYWSQLQLGRCYMSQGRFPEAVEALGACVALRPNAPWGYSVRGLALAQQKHYKEAERDLNRAVELDPGMLVSRLNRGVVYWSQKKHAKALADFEAVLEQPKEKRLVEAAYYRGQLHLQLGAVQEALRDFSLVAKEKPGFRPVFLLLAQVHIALGEEAGALKDLDSYLAGTPAHDPRSWAAHAQRGQRLRLMYSELPPDRRRKPSGKAIAALALSELQKAVKLGGRRARVFDDLGAMFEFTGDLKKAVIAYSNGLKLAQKDVKLLNKRAWAYDQLNKRDLALEDFTEAVRIDPENAEAHSGLGYVRALQQLPPEAQREADLALLHGADLRAPYNYLNLHNVATIYATLGAAGDGHAAAYQDVAMALLRRAVKVWKKDRTGPSEIQMIEGEEAFKSLRGRRDFQDLLRDGS